MTVWTKWCGHVMRRRTKVRHKSSIIGCRMKQVSLPAEPWSRGWGWNFRHRPVVLRMLAHAFIGIQIAVNRMIRWWRSMASELSTVSLWTKQCPSVDEVCMSQDTIKIESIQLHSLSPLATLMRSHYASWHIPKTVSLNDETSVTYLQSSLGHAR